MLRRATIALLFGALMLWDSVVSATGSERDRTTLFQLSGHPDAMKEYGDWPYVYLVKEESLDLHAGKTRLRVHDVILVTTNEGREMATRRIVLHKSVKIKEMACGTVALNGLWLPLQGGKPLEKKVGDFTEYTIILDSVVKGSICVFEFTLERDGGMWYEEFPMGSKVPVLLARFCVKKNDSVNPSVFVRNQNDAMKITRRTEGDPGPGDWGQCTYEVRDVMPEYREPFVPPREEYQPVGIMYMAGRRNWNDMVLAEGFMFFDACDLSDVGDAKKLVKKILADDPHMGAVIAKVLEFVRNEFQVFEYSGRDLFPSPAKETFEKRMGTINDVSGVAIGLMHMAGVPLELGLVRSASHGSWHGTTYNALQFDRLLPVVKLGESGRMWVDPMCRECGIGDLDWSLAGATGLLFKADIRKDLERFDDVALEAFRAGSYNDAVNSFRYQLVNAHWTDIAKLSDSPEWRMDPETIERIRIRFTPEGHLQGSTHVKFLGQAKIDLRRKLQGVAESEREQWVTSYLIRRHPQAQLLKPPEFEGVEPNLHVFGPKDTLHVHVEFEIRDFLLPGGVAALPTRLLAPAVNNPLAEPQEREAQVWLPYSRCSEHEVILELAPGMQLEQGLRPYQLDGETLRYRSAIQVEKGVLRFQRIMRTRCATLPPDYAQRMYQEYARIAAYESQPVRVITATSKGN